MEDSCVLVERTKSKFYETKNLVNTKLGDHLSRSRSLLSDVNRSLKRSARDDSVQSQRYFAESFVSFRENDSFRRSNEAFRCGTRLTSPTFMPKNNSALGVTETPKHMTQAMWLLNTSNVTCKLSNDSMEEEQEKIPDILLKDPADLLRGEIKPTEAKREDKLTELLKDKDFEKTDSNMVRVNTGNSFSYDIISSLDFSKQTVGNRNVYGTNDLINDFLNDSCTNLENLTDLFNSKKNDLGSFNDFVNFTNAGDCNTKIGLSQLDEMFTQEFVNNAGVDFKQHSEALTNTLLKLNEQDRLKEFELAPKILVNEEKVNKEKLEPEKIEFAAVPSTSKDTITGLETDLLGSFTVIRDDKIGRRMYRLSEFDQKFKTGSKVGTSVQVQTEPEEHEPMASTKRYKTNVKVVYHNSLEGKDVLTNRANSLKKQDLYAQQIISNLEDRLERKLRAGAVENESSQAHSAQVADPVAEYEKEVQRREVEIMDRLRAQRRPMYDLMTLNMRSGVRNRTMCRGGRRNSNFLHESLGRESLNERVDELYYISPSNRKLVQREYSYGYDLSDEPQESATKTMSRPAQVKKQDSQPKRVDSRGSKPDMRDINPLDHFEQWWRMNTKELNALRDKFVL